MKQPGDIWKEKFQRYKPWMLQLDKYKARFKTKAEARQFWREALDTEKSWIGRENKQEAA